MMMISEKGSELASKVISEVALRLPKTLKHAKFKPAQTFGILKRKHVSIRKFLKVLFG